MLTQQVFNHFFYFLPFYKLNHVTHKHMKKNLSYYYNELSY